MNCPPVAPGCAHKRSRCQREISDRVLWGSSSETGDDLVIMMNAALTVCPVGIRPIPSGALERQLSSPSLSQPSLLDRAELIALNCPSSSMLTSCGNFQLTTLAVCFTFTPTNIKHVHHTTWPSATQPNRSRQIGFPVPEVLGGSRSSFRT